MLLERQGQDRPICGVFLAERFSGAARLFGGRGQRVYRSSDVGANRLGLDIDLASQGQVALLGVMEPPRDRDLEMRQPLFNFIQCLGQCLAFDDVTIVRGRVEESEKCVRGIVAKARQRVTNSANDRHAGVVDSISRPGTDRISSGMPQ